MAASIRRVLVFVQKTTDKRPTPVKFTQSVVNHFCPSKDAITVSIKLEEDKLIIYQNGSQQVTLKRPCFCPIHNMVDADRSSLKEEVTNRGVDVGAVVVLETSDGKILLTRRAKHLRIFPGVWVPPGGHIEVGESIYEAGLRELKEETGLNLNTESVESIQTLALWESSFPYRLSLGLPRRHHIVVYLHAKLTPPNTAEHMNSQMRLDASETDACTWLSRNVVEAVVLTSDEDANNTGSRDDLPPVLSMTVMNENGSPEESKMDTSVLLHRAPPDGIDVERVSTGTKFALSEWLKLR